MSSCWWLLDPGVGGWTRAILIKCNRIQSARVATSIHHPKSVLENKKKAQQKKHHSPSMASLFFNRNITQLFIKRRKKNNDHSFIWFFSKQIHWFSRREKNASRPDSLFRGASGASCLPWSDTPNRDLCMFKSSEKKIYCTLWWSNMEPTKCPLGKKEMHLQTINFGWFFWWWRDWKPHQPKKVLEQKNLELTAVAIVDDHYPIPFSNCLWLYNIYIHILMYLYHIVGMMY